DPEGACLERYSSVEYVEGSGVSSRCPAHCLTVGTATYVSTVCPPLPANAVALDPTDEACVTAMAALDAAACGADAAAADANAAEDGSPSPPDGAGDGRVPSDASTDGG